MNLNAGVGLFTFYLVGGGVVVVVVVVVVVGGVVAVVVVAWRLKPTRRSPQNSAWLLYLKGIMTQPTARNRMRLQGRDSYVVILIPERADLLGL